MACRVVRFEPTPNPNAIKCVLDGAPEVGAKSFRTAESAVGEPVAARLFAVAGVAGLLFGDGWLTVNKAPEAEWRAVKQGVERALAAAG